jgi:glutaredoxin
MAEGGASMFDAHEWKTVNGKGDPENLILLSLSTCGFCTSARKYLDNRGLAFKYLELDQITPEEKADIKHEFQSKFGRRPSFPTLIIEKERFLVGFVKGHWDEEVAPEGEKQ